MGSTRATFLTADRLAHAWWDEIAARAARILAAGEAGDDETVETSARELRLFLRDYV